MVCPCYYLELLSQVDNSPPTSGAFAVETEHAASLTRHRDGAMTYEHVGTSTSLNLAWVGFADPHSGILSYYITVGTEYAGEDLAGVRKTI